MNVFSSGVLVYPEEHTIINAQGSKGEIKMNEDELVEQYESNMRLAEENKMNEVELTELEENVELYKDTDLERQYFENEIKNSHERLDDHNPGQMYTDRIDAENKLAEVKTELRSFDEEVKLAVAKDEDTSAQTLDFLSEDRSEEVREAVINNPNASEETLENMDKAAMLENDFQALNVNDQVDATDGQFNNDNDKQTESSGSMRM